MAGNRRPVTLVTGASRGIGHAVVQRVAAMGHEVVHLSRTPPRSDLPGSFYCVDLGDEKETAEVLDEVTRTHSIDNLVNNAAAVHVAPLEKITWQSVAALVDLNLRAMLQCIQAISPGMKRKGRGRIVNLGSRAALGKAERTIYGMTKAGVVGLSRSLALELAGYGITVNVVSPGPVETEMFRTHSRADDPAVQALTRAIPVGRMGRPEDIAAAIGFFLSDEAGFVTGQNLYVCGGLSVGAAPI
jgi:3-oxoacyl-[acyl-carrier protein] reductase